MARNRVIVNIQLRNKICHVFSENCFRNLHFRNSSSNVQSVKNIKKVLIANRGEIACRIIKTAKQMGIKTVAVYSTADVHSKHVALADESLWIGPSEAKHSYLDMNKILEAIKTSGADALHPGYGFLSENATFVKLLESEDITFIGPSSASILQMGDKLESKRVAQSAGVNTIPGYDNVIVDAKECIKRTHEQLGGYPIMIKASAGGGGKGMRVAYSDAEASRAILRYKYYAIRMATLYICTNVNAVYRDVTRKSLKKHPDHDTRCAMGEQAVALCRSISYTSVGTVEFLVDSNKKFYFLEMNTRLQVEHPVTECVTGVDLVEEMFRVAEGKVLTLKQEDIKINGWAIESRIYAEDPYKKFGMPSTGMINKYIEPRHVRCDSGVETGSQINIFYDSMIAKLITHRSNRKLAIEASITALDNYVIHGMLNNAALLRDILSSDNFALGRFHTKYLEEEYKDGFQRKQLQKEDTDKLVTLASVLYMSKELRHYSSNSQNNELINMDLVVPFQEDTTRVRVSLITENIFHVTHGKVLYKVDCSYFNLSQRIITFRINNEDVTLQLLKTNSDGSFDIKYKCVKYNLKVIPRRAFELLHIIKTDLDEDMDKCTKTPMPGLVKQVYCNVGDYVTEGQEICVIEAMKMQNTILSNGSGIVAEVNMVEDGVVNEDDVLIRIQ